jgi:DNA-binding CsgD family transcriptional regulator
MRLVVFLKVLFYSNIFCLAILSTQSINAQQSEDFSGFPLVTNYGPKSYMAGIQNWDVIQDQSGFLYVANNLGLLQFDGETWKRYGINNTKVRSVHQGRNGKIYVGSQADFGYLSPDDSGELTYYSLSDSLPMDVRDFDETWKIYEIDDKIYFCTFQGIYVYDGISVEVIDSTNRLDICFKVDNTLYAFVPGQGLFFLKDHDLIPVKNGEFFQEKRISNILNFDRDRLLITTFEHGAFLYDGTIEPFLFKGDFWHDDFLINYSTRLRNGSLALGTQNAGLFLITENGELISHLTKESGLMDLTINYIFEDNYDGLWLAMNNGLARVDLNSPFTFVDDRMNLAGSGYAALRKDNRVYLGTNIGLYVWEDGTIKFVEGSAGQVYTIQEVNDQILVGHHNGTFVVENNQVRKIADVPGTWIFRTIPEKPNLILQGHYAGLSILEWRNGSFVFKGKVKGFEESSRLIEIEGDQIWISHGYKGVFKVRMNEEFSEVVESKLYNSDNGFPSDVLINVFRISNKLVFTANPGFYEYNAQSDKFESSGDFAEIFENTATMVDMESDVLGNVYFIEQKKLGILKIQSTNEFQIYYNTFNKIKSYWNDDLANIIVLDNQNILIGGKQGFIHYSPRRDIPRAEKNRIRLKSIVNRGEYDSILFNGNARVEGAENLIQSSFPFRQNSFTIDFISPHFESDNEIQYQYKLENFEENWSDWTYENRKEYTNLREGEYTFWVKSKNIFEEISEPTSFLFQVKPPFYRSILAYIFYVFGTLFTLFFGFKWLDKRYKKKTSMLEEEQDHALKEKDSEIESITQRTGEEIVNLRNEKLQNEIEYKNQELTSSAMHLIQKNQLLANIKNTLKNISKDEKSKQLNNQLGRLVKSIDKDLEGGSEWEQFSDNFDQVHGNFITRLKEKYPTLTPQEIKFAAYLRMNLNTKEIANLLGISVRGVEIGRYRVRKKLELERKDNLGDFLLRF